MVANVSAMDFKATNTTASRTLGDRFAEVWRSVKDFGAQGIGTGHDDTSAIQAAINQAISDGGGVVYFPPLFGGSNFYNITSPLVFSSSPGNVPISLVGQPGIDIYGSKVYGTFAGYLIDHPNSDPQVLRRVYGLALSNTHSQGCGIRLQNSQTAIIEQVTITACLNGVECDANAYCSEIRNSNISSVPATSGTQGNPVVFTGSISGNVLTVSSVSSGTFLLGMMIQGAGITGTGLSIVSFGTGSGGAGTYNLNFSVGTIGSESMTAYSPAVGIYGGQIAVRNCSLTGWDEAIRIGNAGFICSGTRLEVNETGIRVGFDNVGNLIGMSGFTFESLQTERTSLPFDIFDGSAGNISGCILTGTIAPARGILANSSGLVWSAGTVTVTTAQPLYLNPDARGAWTSGTRNIKIEAFGPMAGYGTTGFVTGTWVNSTTFTYPLAVNPGVAYDGVNATWSFEIQYGMRLRNANGLTVKGLVISITPCEQAGVDLFYDGNTSGAEYSFSGVIGGSWILPPSNSKASFNFNQSCDNPSFAMHFADLPGQSSVYAPLIEGLTYSIVDGQKSGGGSLANLGDIAVGGGSQHAQVRYNGTNWTVTGL